MILIILYLAITNIGISQFFKLRHNILFKELLLFTNEKHFKKYVTFYMTTPHKLIPVFDTNISKFTNISTDIGTDTGISGALIK